MVREYGEEGRGGLSMDTIQYVNRGGLKGIRSIKDRRGYGVRGEISCWFSLRMDIRREWRSRDCSDIFEECCWWRWMN